MMPLRLLGLFRQARIPTRWAYVLIGALFLYISATYAISSLFLGQSLAPQREVAVEQRMYSEAWLQARYERIEAFDKDTSNILRSMHCSLEGVFCYDDPLKLSSDATGKSLVGRLTTLVMMPLNNLPDSGVTAIGTSFAQAGLIPQAEAAGFGSQILSPFADIWKHMRNIAYAFMVIIIIVEAFALMFTPQTGGKSAVAIETFLPKLIAVMIMIQFSYTFAGLLIDAMYIVLLVILLVLSPFMKVGDQISYHEFVAKYLFSSQTELPNVILESLLGNPNTLMSAPGTPGYIGAEIVHFLVQLFWVTSREILYLFGFVIGAILSIIIDGLVINGILNALGGSGLALRGLAGSLARLLGPLAGGGLAVTGVVAAAALPVFVIGLYLLFIVAVAVWRVFVVLLKTYVTVIALVIFSPLIILLELMPGNGFGIKKWIKSLISELIVYPVLFGILFFLFVLGNVSGSSHTGLTLPFVSPISGGIKFIIGVILLSLLPQIIADVRRMIEQSVFQSYEAQVSQNLDTARLWANRTWGGGQTVWQTGGAFRQAYGLGRKPRGAPGPSRAAMAALGRRGGGGGAGGAGGGAAGGGAGGGGGGAGGGGGTPPMPVGAGGPVGP